MPPSLCFYPHAAFFIRPLKEKHMDFIIAGVVAVLLAGYLVYALLHPEKF